MPVMPIGACIVAHATERAGHTVHLLDLMFARDARSDIKSAVTGFKPDVVGLSIRNIDNVDMRDPVFYLDVNQRGNLTHHRSPRATHLQANAVDCRCFNDEIGHCSTPIAGQSSKPTHSSVQKADVFASLNMCKNCYK